MFKDGDRLSVDRDLRTYGVDKPGSGCGNDGTVMLMIVLTVIPGRVGSVGILKCEHFRSRAILLLTKMLEGGCSLTVQLSCGNDTDEDD